MSDTTVTTETPTTPTESTQGNDPALRTTEGTIQDQSSATTTPTEQPKAEDKSTDKPEPAAGAPETYADFTAPEGYTLSKDLIGEAAPIFKELNLSQDQAQKLVDFYAKTQTGPAEAQQAAYNETRQGWRNEVLKDTTLSTGNDLKPEVRAAIGRAVDSLGPELSKSFREVMDLTGAGDNPAFVKAMFEFSKFVTEGRPVSGKGPSAAGQANPSAAPKSIASAMFPNLK